MDQKQKKNFRNLKETYSVDYREVFNVNQHYTLLKAGFSQPHNVQNYADLFGAKILHKENCVKVGAKKKHKNHHQKNRHIPIIVNSICVCLQ